MTGSWKQLLVVAFFALAVIVGADLFFSKVAPVRHLREVEDGVADLQRLNPDTLVLGSSHARTLHVLGQELARRTDGQQTLVAVPLENGKIVPYEWLLEHKLKPLVDEVGGDGKPVKSRLRRFVLITEWWDTCPQDAGVLDWNLPARAWTASDFVKDVADEGITPFNRNYLQNRLRRIFSNSSLVFDRTQQTIVWMTVDLLRHKSLALSPEDQQAKVDRWQALVTNGIHCIGNPAQMQAMDQIAKFAEERKLEMTILLFPRKPQTLTEQARNTTLPQFAKIMQEFAATRGIRLIDLTTTSPMRDGDFMDDFDHINPAGNAKFAAWALDHDFNFLLQPPPAPTMTTSK
jgi:hypothetical protein